MQLVAIAEEELARHRERADTERAHAAATASTIGLTERELIWGRSGPGRPRRRTAR
jgi:hypothetical protein